jgi:hypothetical protein
MAEKNQRSAARVAPPVDMGGLDPAQATTLPELARLLKELLRRSCLTSRELGRLAIRNGRSLPASTISEVFSGKLALQRPQVLGIVEACGLSPDEAENWDAAWSFCGRDKTTTELPVIVRRQTERLEERESQIEQQLPRLEDDVRQLRAELSAATDECDRLRSQLNQASYETLAQRERVNELQALWADAERRVGEFSARLEFALAEQQRLEALRDQLLAERHDLVALDELTQLEYDQAAYGRQSYERNQALRTRLDVAERLLVEYQSQVITEVPAVAAAALAPMHNSDARLQLAVDDGDFGQEQVVTLSCGWYCPECGRYGEHTYSVCPHCSHATTRNCRRPVRFVLRQGQAYGSEIRLSERGYHDVPSLPAGDIVVRIVRQG